MPDPSKKSPQPADPTQDTDESQKNKETGPVCLTLENIIDMTGELEHLNELVMLHLSREGAFSGQKSYFTIVTPILDRLEREIRGQSWEGIDREELKDLICCWIDREIELVR